MDKQALTNDNDVEGDEVSNIYNEVRQLDNVDTEDISKLFSSKPENTYSLNEVIKDSLTLRKCNEDYKKFNGWKYNNSPIAEFDRCTTKGCISPLTKFNNIIGHFEGSVNSKESTNIVEHKTLCFKPQVFSSLLEFGNSVYENLSPSIRRGRLWNLQNCHLCSKIDDHNWKYKNEQLDTKISSILDAVSVSFPLPLSFHSQHAWLESQDSRDEITKANIFRQPQETTAVTGLLGTLQNNQLVDLAQDEFENSVDIELRYKDIDIPGFLCSGHTAHSTEAGRVRRVCANVSIRLLNKSLIEHILEVCESMNSYNQGKKEWIMYCLGKIVHVTNSCILKIRNFLISCSSKDYNTASLYINSETKIALLSVSSGVATRRDLNGLLVTSMSFYSDSWSDSLFSPVFPALSSEEGFKFYFSTFFQLTPYIAFDRPPRTLISSVQSIQAVTMPYGAGTSSIRPVHASSPLVSTPLIEELLNSKNCELPDRMPGEDLVVCFANMNDTNEDSIMISESSIGRGLFSYLGYSVHVINSNEKVPSIGEYAHIKNNRWWKVHSKRQPLPPKENEKYKSVPILAGGDGRGKIMSVNPTQSGQLSVKVLRYSGPVTGDKLATGHGQKGTVKVTKKVDMPWGMDKNNQPIEFDIVVSLSSITNRLTVGQYYEMVTGVTAVEEGKRVIINPSTSQDGHTETILYDGRTGNMMERVSEEGDIPVTASWGINRVWQMTQLTWDKQHYTHSSAGKQSVSTPVGRTAGGGVKFGEMETHAIDASGLTKPAQELVSRIDLIDVQICTLCNELSNTCICGDKRSLVNVSIPYSAIVFAESNLLTSGFVSKFNVSF